MVVALYVGAAGVDIVLGQRVEDLRYAHAGRVEAVGREGNLILLDASAHGVDLHHTWYHGELAAHGPVLYGAQLLWRVE